METPSSKGRLEEYLMNSGIDPNLKIDPQLPEAIAEQLVEAGLQSSLKINLASSSLSSSSLQSIWS